MAKKRLIWTTALLVVLASMTATGWAKVTPEEAAHLGDDLTPLGAIKAANEDGSIPAWDGGITTPPAGYTPGDHHPDPFAADELLFTITAANVDQYADKLTPGHQAMLKTYDTFSMKVYPTHRSASNPQRIYDDTKRVATTAELVGGGNGIRGSVISGQAEVRSRSCDDLILDHHRAFAYTTDPGLGIVEN